MDTESINAMEQGENLFIWQVKEDYPFCPICGAVLFKMLMFLGITPEGFVCDNCHTLVSFEGKPIAQVIC